MNINRYKYRHIISCWTTSSLFLISFGLSISCGRQQPDSGYDTAYEYPVKPGTKEWKAFGSYDAMLTACQIPDPILLKISTTNLIETVLNYPLFGNVWWSRNNIRQGFEHMFSEFNGVRELLKREDAGTLLLAKYRGMDPAGFKKGASLEERDNYVMRLQEVEILLAQDAVQAGLTESQRAELKKLALAKYEVKKTLEDYDYRTLDKQIISLFIPSLR